MDEYSRLRKNPSRETCEGIIKRILTTEIQERGKNEHFKSAADFMNYFESLYPASDALVKQVQRAVKALDMPRDERGYFIANKTNEQFAEENELKDAFRKAQTDVLSLEDCEPVFLQTDLSLRTYLIHLIETSSLFDGSYVTLCECCNGILIYTRTKEKLEFLLHGLIS